MTAVPCLSGSCTTVVRGHPAALPLPYQTSLCIPGSRGWRTAQGLLCHPAQVCCSLEVWGTVKILPKCNLSDLQKSFPVDAKEGREKSLKEPTQVIAQVIALARVPACPRPGLSFLLSGWCCRHIHLFSSHSAAFEETTCQIGWSPALCSPQELGRQQLWTSSLSAPQTLLPPCSWAPTSTPFTFALSTTGAAAGSEQENRMRFNAPLSATPGITFLLSTPVSSTAWSSHPTSPAPRAEALHTKTKSIYVLPAKKSGLALPRVSPCLPAALFPVCIS